MAVCVELREEDTNIVLKTWLESGPLPGVGDCISIDISFDYTQSDDTVKWELIVNKKVLSVTKRLFEFTTCVKENWNAHNKVILYVN